ncbi:LAFA_0D00232g1_1 [Lachancea sp. 'fantastica']|nr:LAFA_0D00232g1_1 [Lachancea sp. 'fantastica']
MPELIRLDLPNSRIVNGNQFPAAFSLEASESFKQSPGKMTKYLQEVARTGFFNELLATHGAIVIRNTNTTDPQVISRYINAIGVGSGDEFFEQQGSTATRTRVTDLLSTANEGPSSTYIHQHNEFSRFKRYPGKLFFVCTKYGPQTKGGQTPIVHGAEFFNYLDSIAPKLVNNLASKGLYYAQVWANVTTTRTSWHDLFCFGREISKNDSLSVAKQKAERSVRANVSDDFEWVDGDDLLVHQHTEPVKLFVNSYTGQSHPTFFNSLATYFHQWKSKSYNTPTAQLKYDDGEPIDEKQLELLLKGSINFSYEHQWQEGDIAIIDNWQVSHGRCPWEGGPRNILVSMWISKTEKVYEPWTA